MIVEILFLQIAQILVVVFVVTINEKRLFNCSRRLK